MNTRSLLGYVLLSLLASAPRVQAASGECEQAWTNYNEFKQHNVMEASQYALTVHGAAVRAACGAEALPVPAGTDMPHYPIVRKPKPTQPAVPPKPAKPPVKP